MPGVRRKEVNYAYAAGASTSVGKKLPRTSTPGAHSMKPAGLTIKSLSPCRGLGRRAGI